jgi:hypothetical protein
MKLLVVGLMFVGSLFIGAGLQAQVIQKVYPGITCQPHFPTTSIDDIGYDEFGRVINISEGTAQVNCPVVRDNTVTGTATVVLRVLKGTVVGVTCALVSRRPDGTQGSKRVCGRSR